MPPSRNLRLTGAGRRAEQLLETLEISELPVDPFQIASDHDIEVVAMPATAEGVSGMLVRHSNSFGIAYATHIKSPGFIRFSVAHELGHYFLEGHCDQIPFDANGLHASRSGFRSGDIFELEADHFAAGLLMPASHIRKTIRRARPGISCVDAIESTTESSLTASAIRYAELASEPVAIIVTKDGKVDYAFLSKGTRAFPGTSWPLRGAGIPSGTETARFWTNKDNIANRKRSSDSIDVMDWLGGKRSIEALEDVVGLGSYGRALTVLTWPDIEELDELDEEESELSDRWTPRFR